MSEIDTKMQQNPYVVTLNSNMNLNCCGHITCRCSTDNIKTQTNAMAQLTANTATFSGNTAGPSGFQPLSEYDPKSVLIDDVEWFVMASLGENRQKQPMYRVINLDGRTRKLTIAGQEFKLSD